MTRPTDLLLEASNAAGAPAMWAITVSLLAITAYLFVASAFFGCPACYQPDLRWPVTLYRRVASETGDVEEGESEA
jgi:hypothetical protein